MTTALRPEMAEVAMFAHIACRPEEELDLGQAALAIAEPEYPALDIPAYLRTLDRLARDAASRMTGGDKAAGAASLVAYLLHEEGFRGNVEHYDDPRNSFLNEVIDRRLGIPITLSVVMMEVARRAGVPLFGVSFPGHFLLRAGPPSGAPMYINPFDGRIMAAWDLRELLHRAIGERRDPTPQELEVTTKRAILTRMLNNLRNIYVRAGDQGRLHLCEERIRVLTAQASPFVRRGEGGLFH